MGRFDTIKTTIDANIKENGNQEITGQKMNTILTEMVNATDAELTELESRDNINFNFANAVEELGASITAQNLWAQVGGYTGGLVRVKYFKKLLIKGGANRSSYAFLKSGFSSQGNPVNYAGDYTELRFVEPNETIVVNVPADAQFLYLYLYSGDIDYRPALLQWQDEWTPQFPVWYGPQFIVDHKNKVFRTGAGSRTFTTINGVQAYINEGTEIPFYPIAEGETFSRVLIYNSANHTLVDKAWDKIDKSDILFASFFYPSVSQPAINSKVRVNYCPIAYKEIEEESINNVGNIVDTIQPMNATINNSGYWQPNSSAYSGGIVPVEKSFAAITIQGSAERSSVYCFLKSLDGLESGSVPDYATGYTAQMKMSPGEIITAPIPVDAQYLYVYLFSVDIDYRPQIVKWEYANAYIGEVAEDAKTNKDIIRGLSPKEIKVATWNIGHYSGGANPNSSITSESYDDKLSWYRELVYDILDADVIGLNEYSAVFGTSATGTKSAKDVLFNDYAVKYEGVQRNYSCNALYGNICLENIERHEFESLKDVTITHTSLIKATDYYYITADMYLRGRKVKLVTAHLAFDSNKPSVIQLLQIAELIEAMKSETRVVMIGDWNVSAQSDFDAFVEDGYTLLNDGSIPTYPSTSPNRALDNIIVKGVKMTNTGVVQNILSDHIPMYATISV